MWKIKLVFNIYLTLLECTIWIVLGLCCLGLSQRWNSMNCICNRWWSQLFCNSRGIYSAVYVTVIGFCNFNSLLLGYYFNMCCFSRVSFVFVIEFLFLERTSLSLFVCFNFFLEISQTLCFLGYYYFKMCGMVTL